ncbi:hypothetical protein BGLA2_20003 [Burkholderia gladioli]|nr:hypothetical protein BGLA2_20003 [Burkholderia gladioli]
MMGAASAASKTAKECKLLFLKAFTEDRALKFGSVLPLSRSNRSGSPS